MKRLTMIALVLLAMGFFVGEALAKRTCVLRVYAYSSNKKFKTASFTKRVGGFFRRPKHLCRVIAKERNFQLTHKRFFSTRLLPKSNHLCKTNPRIKAQVTAYILRGRKRVFLHKAHKHPKDYRQIFKCAGYRDCTAGPCAKWQYLGNNRYKCRYYFNKYKKWTYCHPNNLKSTYRWVNHGHY